MGIHGHHNLTAKDREGQDAFRLYGLSDAQMRSLHDQIGEALGLASQLTAARLREVYDVLHKMFGADPQLPSHIDHHPYHLNKLACLAALGAAASARTS